MPSVRGPPVDGSFRGRQTAGEEMQVSFEIQPMSRADWQACRRDALTDPECSPWLRALLETCTDPKNASWVRLATRWAVDRVTGDYLVRLPSLMGGDLADQFCGRVGERLYGLRGLGVGDPKVFFTGGSSPQAESSAEVQIVLSAAFAVHGSYAEDIGRDPIRQPVFVPGPPAATSEPGARARPRGVSGAVWTS
ncbi:hypothetical protein CDN99_23465 [Roseateles aquatilis]|uniref:Uncharacterized protein n=1 Tax=Roseateles aquatilis TaxID=431061 RepID=A0A246IWV7_9BURK|nr:hypothetical protein CDN99_23465 [Roseateles aquatilis]